MPEPENIIQISYNRLKLYAILWIRKTEEEMIQTRFGRLIYNER
jgi:hypothetical protein